MTTPLSIVIPAYNEARRLPASLAKIAAAREARVLPEGFEIVVVDDGSADATAEAAEREARAHGLPLRLLRVSPNRGKGHAVKTGVLAASGEKILVTDADLSTPIEDWTKLDRAGAPVAIGSRAVAGADIREEQPFYRVAMGKLFNLLVRLLAVPGIADTQCGFKLFSRGAARDVFSRAAVERFAWDVEALLLARKLGHRIAEVPVVWLHMEDSRVSLWGGAQAYLDLLAIRWRVEKRLRAERRGSGNPPA